MNVLNCQSRQDLCTIFSDDKFSMRHFVSISISLQCTGEFRGISFSGRPAKKNRSRSPQKEKERERETAGECAWYLATTTQQQPDTASPLFCLRVRVLSAPGPPPPPPHLSPVCIFFLPYFRKLGFLLLLLSPSGRRGTGDKKREKSAFYVENLTWGERELENLMADRWKEEHTQTMQSSRP